MRFKWLMFFAFASWGNIFAQSTSYYFPPASSTTWDTISPVRLQWETDSIDSFFSWLETKNTKGFLVLYQGKIVVEHYFGTFTQDSLWYWASAGKSLTSFLIGMAQEQGLLKISDKTSAYLREGWTSCPQEKEDLITIRDQLTMTCGFETLGKDLDCEAPSCLTYLTDAGTRWYYHNASYTLLEDVVEKASGTTYNLFTYQNVGKRIGMGGAWYDNVRYGKARDMARFGLLVLNNGIWDTDTLMYDQNYFEAMVNSSQTLNPSYGYLWWLNGKDSYIQPGLALSFQGEIVPHAPDDMFAAMGKNDQRIYIVPSLDLVVVRIGNAADEMALALSGFDDGLWERLMHIIDPSTASHKVASIVSVCWFNAEKNEISFNTSAPVFRVLLFDQEGKRILIVNGFDMKSISTLTIKPGVYLCLLFTQKGVQTQRVAIR